MELIACAIAGLGKIQFRHNARSGALRCYRPRLQKLPHDGGSTARATSKIRSYEQGLIWSLSTMSFVMRLLHKSLLAVVDAAMRTRASFNRVT